MNFPPPQFQAPPTQAPANAAPASENPFASSNPFAGGGAKTTSFVPKAFVPQGQKGIMDDEDEGPVDFMSFADKKKN